MSATVRDAQPGDHAAIHALVAAAFEQEDEAVLVDQLRADGDAAIELVAADNAGQLVGHILFSPLAIERDEGGTTALALAPVAVLPAHQRRGIGSALIRAGIEHARAKNYPAIIVLGDPAYYPRFGFSAALAQPLDAPFDGDEFMAMELTPGALSQGGRVIYARAFGL